MKKHLISLRSDLLAKMQDCADRLIGDSLPEKIKLVVSGIAYDQTQNRFAVNATVVVDEGLASDDVYFFVNSAPGSVYMPFTLLTADTFFAYQLPEEMAFDIYSNLQPFHRPRGSNQQLRSTFARLAAEYYAATLLLVNATENSDTPQAQLVDLEATAEYYKGLVYDCLRSYIIDNQGEPIPACRIETLELVNVYEHGAEVCIRLTGFNTDRSLQAAYRVSGAGMGQLVIQQTGSAITPEFFEHCRYTCKFLPVRLMIDISSYARKWAIAADALALLQEEARNADTRANA